MMPEYWRFTQTILVIATFMISAINTDDKRAPLIHINQSFEAEIEATFVTEQRTIIIKEVFQSANRLIPEKASITQTTGGKDVKLVFDYTTEQLFIVADGKCQFKNSSKYVDDIFTGKVDPLVKYPVLSSKDLMRAMQDAKRELINQTIVIRGIETSLWRFHVKKGVVDVTVDSYFTDGWHSESGQKVDFPVRFDIYGKISSRPYKVVFDYYFFEYHGDFSYDGTTFFEMPATIYCDGANTSVKLPPIPDSYSYTAEIINFGFNTVEVSKIWYDSENKLLRQDSHPPDYALNGYPVSEIYDSKTGVVYKIDNILQNCTVKSIEQDEMDNSIILNIQLKDTLAYLKNPSNLFAYVEQRMRRNIMCDVYMSERNITLPMGKTASSLFVYYFMSDDWRLYPDIGGPEEMLKNVPVMFELFTRDDQSPEFTLDMVYNYVDFTNYVTPDMFSVPQCYGRNTEIYFKIAFPGTWYPSMERELHKKFHSLIADSTGVLPHRVLRVSFQTDMSFIYARAAITDRTKPESQFLRYRKKQLKTTDVKETIQNLTLNSCASKCLEAEYDCSAFDFSNDGLCHLTEAIIANLKDDVAKSSTADFYTRSNLGPTIKEVAISEVWKKLTQIVSGGDFAMSFVNSETKETITYVARTVELLYGAIDDERNPEFPAQMTYKAQYSEPVMKKLIYHETWYDSKRNLFRLDEYHQKGSLYPITIINDFNEGVSYHIDKALGNCSILPLADDPIDASEQKKDHTVTLKMKSPDQLFKMDSKVKFYGQKTVRGILCDVYEAIRNDYIVPGTKNPTISTFRYYFVNGNWKDRSDTGKSDDVKYTPLQLEIIASIVNYYAVYNFFDFADDVPPMDIFDIQSCFEKREEFQFQIIFSGAPTESAEYDPQEFIQQAVKEMATIAKVNVLRIQEAVLEYDPKFIYLTANLLTYPPGKAHLKKTAGKAMIRKGDKKQSKVKSVDACADACMKTKGFTCNSFDFCLGAKGDITCQLFSPNGNELSDSKTCDHYSRVVPGGKPPVEPLIAIGLLKDAVVAGTLKVTVNTENDEETAQTYTAIKLRDDVTSTDRNELTMENNIKKFDRYKNDTSIIASEQMHHYPKMAVDDCANLCLGEPNNKCESFAFCFTQGDCYVASSHPDQKPEMLESHTGCSVYNRNYLYRYDKEPGVSTVTTGDKSVDVTSESDCAKHCTTNGDFLCQSFQYCSQINECTLSKVHKMDIPDTEISGNIMCDIYFRKYIDDFDMTKGKRVALVNNQILTDISEEQCAKACMEEESFNCASFDYCANTTTCRLTNHDTLNSGQVTIETSAFCNHFRLECEAKKKIASMVYTENLEEITCVEVTQIIKGNGKPAAYTAKVIVKKGTIYSTSHLTAVALCTLIASFLFGGVGMTVFLRRKPTVSI